LQNPVLTVISMPCWSLCMEWTKSI